MFRSMALLALLASAVGHTATEANGLKDSPGLKMVCPEVYDDAVAQDLFKGTLEATTLAADDLIIGGTPQFSLTALSGARPGFVNVTPVTPDGAVEEGIPQHLFVANLYDLSAPGAETAVTVRVGEGDEAPELVTDWPLGANEALTVLVSVLASADGVEAIYEIPGTGKVVRTPAVEVCDAKLAGAALTAVDVGDGSIAYAYRPPGYTRDSGVCTITGSLEMQALVSCWDGIRNGDEAGVDCGGTYCPACS